MKLQTVEIDGKVYVETEGGNPILAMDDGKRVPFDVPHSYATISRLNNELKTSRESATGIETRLRTFDGIEDPDAARSALETVRNLKDGDLVKAGEVEVIKSQAKKTAEDAVQAEVKRGADKVRATEKERDHYRTLFTSEKIGRVFSGSKFIADKCIIPAPMMQSQFGGHFRVEDDGKIVAYDGDQKIFSRTKHGDIAEPDEALEILVEKFPYRDSIMKGTGSSGSGARSSMNAVGQKQMSRAEFDALPQERKSKVAREYAIYD